MCQQLLTEPLFLQAKDTQRLSITTQTLNFGTGRSVSLYLVQRRPILGSRTISTGGIPGFCTGREEDKNPVSRTTTPHGANLLQSRITEKKKQKQKTDACLFVLVFFFTKMCSSGQTPGQDAEAHHGSTATLEPIMEVGCSFTTAAASPRRTYGHAESLPIVAIQFVGSLLQRRVDDQLVTSPVVAPLLCRAADGMTVHAVRQT